jgi:hypothetical protein
VVLVRVVDQAVVVVSIAEVSVIEALCKCISNLTFEQIVYSHIIDINLPRVKRMKQLSYIVWLKCVFGKCIIVIHTHIDHFSFNNFFGISLVLIVMREIE